MSSAEKPTNPFYIVLIAVGVAFVKMAVFERWLGSSLRAHD